MWKDMAIGRALCLSYPRTGLMSWHFLTKLSTSAELMMQALVWEHDQLA
jgi:hypothetical protein